MSSEIESGSSPPQAPPPPPQTSSTPTPSGPSPVPYERFKSVRDDYRALMEEHSALKAQHESRATWLSPEDHSAAVETAVQKAQRTGDLAVKLVAAGVERDSREFRFLASEFDEVEPDAWDAKLEELREQSPAFFPSVESGQRQTTRTNPETGTRSPSVPSGGVVTAEKIRGMSTEEYLAHRDEILKSIGHRSR